LIASVSGDGGEASCVVWAASPESNEEASFVRNLNIGETVSFQRTYSWFFRGEDAACKTEEESADSKDYQHQFDQGKARLSFQNLSPRNWILNFKYSYHVVVWTKQII